MNQAAGTSLGAGERPRTASSTEVSSTRRRTSSGSGPSISSAQRSRPSMSSQAIDRVSARWWASSVLSPRSHSIRLSTIPLPQTTIRMPVPFPVPVISRYRRRSARPLPETRKPSVKGFPPEAKTDQGLGTEAGLMANVRLKGPTGDREPDAVRMYARMTDVRWSGVDENDIETTEIDLRDRLLFAAGSLAADFGEELSVDLAEALVFSSAEGPMVSASVTEFVPILAERRARQAFRSDASAARSAVPVPRPAVPEPRPAVPTPRPAVPAPRPSVPP